MKKIKFLRYYAPVEGEGLSHAFDKEGLLEFFQTLFGYFDKEGLSAADYCNDGSVIAVVWVDDQQESDIDVGDFIVAAYESMSLWHDGKRGYQLLSLLGIHYQPGPMGSGEDENVQYLMENVFDEHFAAGGTV